MLKEYTLIPSLAFQILHHLYLIYHPNPPNKPPIIINGKTSSFLEYILYILAKELRHTISQGKKKKITHTHTHTNLFLSEIKAYNNEKEKKKKTKLGCRHFATDTHQCVLLLNIMFKHKVNYSSLCIPH